MDIFHGGFDTEKQGEYFAWIMNSTDFFSSFNLLTYKNHTSWKGNI